MRASDLRRSALRVRMLQVLFLLAFGSLALRAAHLTVIDRRGFERFQDQTDHALRLAPYRGLVVDRGGAELAVTLEAPSVYVVPSLLGDASETARHLAPLLDFDVGEVRERLTRASRFVFLARWVSPEVAQRVRDLDLAGVGIVDEPRRVYPNRQLAGRVVGFANIDGEGVRGIEQMEDAWLRGEPRQVAVEREGRGRLLLAEGLDPRASAGGDVALTLDAVLQSDAERALDRAVRDTEARGGLVLTLDPRSGDVLCIAERPGFDPNAFRDVRFAQTRSRAMLDALEPGSTLKLFVVAGALERGVIARHERIDTDAGRLAVPGKVIRDRHDFGPLDPGGILRVSSNVGAAKLAFALGPQAHWRTLRDFGFGGATGSGFPEESSGLLRDWRGWRPLDHATIAFGQGVSITALQLAAATAALADGGVWRRPRLVLARRGRDGAWVPASPTPARRVVSPSTATALLDMMSQVVGPEGTGRLAGLRDVAVAGKTGTAQKLDAATGTYARDRYIAWFVGVVPADDPRLVIVTMLDEPRQAHTGGAAAAPLFAAVAAAQLRGLGIVTEPLPGEVRVARALPQLEGRVLLPDFRGLSPDEVQRIARSSRLRLEVVGRGHAVAQEPGPGTVVAADASRVRVRFAEGG